MKDKLTAAGVIVAIALGVVGLFTGDTFVTNPTEVREVVGATPGNEFLNKVFLRAGHVTGGGCLSTSTAATGNIGAVLTAKQLENYNCVSMVINKQGGGALTFPASSTIGFMNKVGDTADWYIENASTTATAVMTITAGTGINLVAVDTNTDVIDGTERSIVRCIRMPDTDIDCYVTELVDAD